MQQEQVQPRGNGTRLLIIFFSVITGIATGAWDVVLPVMAGLLLLSNWLSDLAVKKLPSVKRGYGQVRSRDLPFNSGATVQKAPVSPHFVTSEIAETPDSDAETEAEKISFAETQTAEALARLIIDNKLNLTDAVKIGFGAKSGERYQKYSRLVKEARDRLDRPEIFKDGERVPMDFPVSGRAA